MEPGASGTLSRAGGARAAARRIQVGVRIVGSRGGTVMSESVKPYDEKPDAGAELAATLEARRRLATHGRPDSRATMAPWVDPRRVPAPQPAQARAPAGSAMRIPSLEPEWMPPMPPLDLGGRRRLIGLIGRLATIALGMAAILAAAFIATRPDPQSYVGNLLASTVAGKTEAGVSQSPPPSAPARVATTTIVPSPQAPAPQSLPVAPPPAVAASMAIIAPPTANALPTANASPTGAGMQGAQPAAPAVFPAPNPPSAATGPTLASAPPLAPRPADMPAAATEAKAAPDNASADRPGIAATVLDALVERAEKLMSEGDFASARLLLQRAAEARSAHAALALGATYDPAILKKIGAVGTVPDAVRARQWYARAAELGSSDARRRLEAMGEAGRVSRD